MSSSASLARRGHRAERLRGDRQPVAHAGGLDHDLAGAQRRDHLAAHRGDHASALRQGCLERRPVGVADRHGEGVGRVVRLGRLRQREQRADHALHLLLGGRAAAAHRLLDRLRRVGEAGHAGMPADSSTTPRACPTAKARVGVAAE